MKKVTFENGKVWGYAGKQDIALAVMCINKETGEQERLTSQNDGMLVLRKDSVKPLINKAVNAVAESLAHQVKGDWLKAFYHKDKDLIAKYKAEAKEKYEFVIGRVA
jgi:hypothetical protein